MPRARLADTLDHLRRVDRPLGRVIDAVGPMSLRADHRMETFPSLVRSIVFQQLSGKAAQTIHGRLLALVAPKGEPLGPRSFARVSDEELSACGLSGAKTAYLRDLCERAARGELPDRARLLKMSDAAIIEALTAVKGIGVWSVEMLLIFNLRRPDVLPVADLGVRKGHARVQGLVEMPTAAELMAFGERWRPFRSVATWYLWRALELPDEVFTKTRRAPRRSDKGAPW